MNPFLFKLLVEEGDQRVQERAYTDLFYLRSFLRLVFSTFGSFLPLVMFYVHSFYFRSFYVRSFYIRSSFTYGHFTFGHSTFGLSTFGHSTFGHGFMYFHCKILLGLYVVKVNINTTSNISNPFVFHKN
jgi:hypothetical protein